MSTRESKEKMEVQDLMNIGVDEDDDAVREGWRTLYGRDPLVDGPMI